MLELQPGMTIADLGSGCGITANTFSVFGCSNVMGFEVRAPRHAPNACVVSRTHKQDAATWHADADDCAHVCAPCLPSFTSILVR